MSTDLIIKQKQQAWAGFAVLSHNTLLEIENKAAIQIAELSEYPTEINQISEAEAKLKNCKAQLKEIEEKRKSVTSKLDPWTEKMMAPEKQLKAAISSYEPIIINLKRAKQTQDDLEANKTKEFNSLIETFKIHINNSKLAHEQTILSSVVKCYEYGLNNYKDGSIKVGDEILTYEQYVNKCKWSKTAKDFTITQPSYVPKLITLEQVNEVWINASSSNVYMDGKLLAGKFSGDMEEKFKYFEIALKDKEKAIETAKQQAASEQIAKEKETANQNIGASLVANAVPMNNEPATKALKETYAIDMPDDQQSALLIIAAFGANINKCASKVRGSWLNLSVKQMGEKLSAIKTEDNALEITGIVFKKVDKL